MYIMVWFATLPNASECLKDRQHFGVSMRVCTSV